MEEEENDEEGRHRRGRQGSGAGDRGVVPGSQSCGGGASGLAGAAGSPPGK